MAQAQTPARRRDARIISLAASPSAAGLVLCGSNQGDVFGFALPPDILAATPGEPRLHCTKAPVHQLERRTHLLNHYSRQGFLTCADSVLWGSR